MNIWGAGQLCLVLFLVWLATVTSAVAEKNQQLLILNQPGHQNAKSLGRFSDRVCYDVTKVEYFGTVVEDKHLLDKLSYPLLGRCAALGDLKRFLNDLVLLHQQQGFVGTQVFMPQENNLRRGVLKVKIVHRRGNGIKKKPGGPAMNLSLDVLNKTATEAQDTGANRH